jgi:hypothetical protein
MKTHRWIPHVVTQARTVPVETLTGSQRTDPLVQTARRILILALVLGGLGTEAVATSGYASVGQASAHQPAGNIRLAASASPISTGHITDSPWMY